MEVIVIDGDSTGSTLDVCKRGHGEPRYRKKDHHMISALVYFDLKPHESIETFLEVLCHWRAESRVPAFDELNDPDLLEEVQASRETFGKKMVEQEC